MWRCRHKKLRDEPRRHNDIMSPRLVQIAARGNYLVIIIIGGWGEQRSQLPPGVTLFTTIIRCPTHYLVTKLMTLYQIIPALTSPRRNYEDTWQCETPRVKTTQASIDVMGHNNMTIMSLTTTHAVPGGTLLTPIMWRVLCCQENIATGKYHFEVWSQVQVLTLRDSRGRRTNCSICELCRQWRGESHWGDIIKTSRGAVTNIWLP